MKRVSVYDKMTNAERRKTVRKAYKPYMSRKYSDTEIDAEIENLRRKLHEGTADDFSFRLACSLDFEENKGRY